MLWIIVVVVILVGGAVYLYSAQQGSENGETEKATLENSQEKGGTNTEGAIVSTGGNPDDVVNDIISQAAGDNADGENDGASLVTSDVEPVLNMGNSYEESTF